MFFYAHPVRGKRPLYSKSTALENRNFPYFSRPGKTALREIINLRRKFDAYPVV